MKLALLCIAKFILVFLIVGSSILALAPDEAQYWTWSQALDFGYYSKPPAISWQIFCTTTLFGNNELGVRFGAMLIGIGLTLTLYFLARAARLSERIALFSAALFTFSPMGFYLSLATTTDGGSILCLMLALFPIIKALAEEKPPNYSFVGLFIALGALYKWTIFFLWPLLIIALCCFPLLRHRSFFFGLMISFLGLIPSFYWNLTHEWATYKHVFATLFAPSRRKSGPNFIDFFGAQIALFSPLLVGILFYNIKRIAKSPTLPLRFLALFLWLSLFALGLSFVKKMQANWALYFYPPIMILIGWIVAEKVRLFYAAFLSSLALVLFSFSIPFVQSHALLPISYALNPYRQNMGSQKLEQALEEVGYDAAKDFLFSDKYQNTSLLSFYGPAQKRAYFFNLGISRKNQFSYWPQMAEQEKGNRGYFVVIENRKMAELPWYEQHYQEKLQPYFASVEYVGYRELFRTAGEGVKHALLFKCDGYLGTAPANIEKY